MRIHCLFSHHGSSAATLEAAQRALDASTPPATRASSAAEGAGPTLRQRTGAHTDTKDLRENSCRETLPCCLSFRLKSNNRAPARTAQRRSSTPSEIMLTDFGCLFQQLRFSSAADAAACSPVHDVPGGADSQQCRSHAAWQGQAFSRNGERLAAVGKKTVEPSCARWRWDIQWLPIAAADCMIRSRRCRSLTNCSLVADDRCRSSLGGARGGHGPCSPRGSTSA